MTKGKICVYSRGGWINKQVAGRLPSAIAMVPPSEMMQVLHAPYAESVRSNLRWASLEMLKELYQQNATHPLVGKAQAAFAEAISKWSDEQVSDFLVNEFFEPPFSAELLLKPADERREVLSSMYSYLFSEWAL
jgi:hypothetical protein